MSSSAAARAARIAGGNFVWSNQRLPYTQSGQWGYLRVLPAGDARIQPLGAGGSGARQAEAEPQPQAVPNRHAVGTGQVIA